MNKFNITKYIPFKIKIKTLYWVNKEKEINRDLKYLFNLIDNDSYCNARKILQKYSDKWTELSFYSPEWFQLEYLSQFARAEAMLDFLQDPQ